MQVNNKRYLVAIDFETANSHPLSACQIGVIVFDGGELVYEYENLIKPPKKYGTFNYYNTKIHNIRAKDVVNEKNWQELYKDLKEYFKDAVFVAHNAAFDMNVLRHLNHFYGIELPITQYYDTVELSRKIFPYLPNHKLNTVSDHLEIDLDHHDAKSDAYACAMIVFKSLQMIEAENISELFEKTNMLPKLLTI